MKFQHDEKLEVGKIKILSLISLLMGFSQGLFVYVMSSYFKESSGTENVGVFYFISFFVVLIVLLNLHKIVKKIGKSDFFYLSMLFKIFSIIFLLFVSPGRIGIAAVIVYNVFLDLEWVGLDMLLESYSSDKKSGQIRGAYLVSMNVGFLLSPLVSAFLLGRYGYYGIFVWSLFLNVVVLLFGILKIGKANHRFVGKLGVWDVIKKTAKRKDISRILYISFVLDFFFALMVIYSPMYLLSLGFSWEELGIIFTVMLASFVLIQYPAGLLADKKFGEKEMLIGAILIMSLSTLSIYFITPGSVVLWSFIFFITRIGAAIIQILRDSYFYKRIDAHDVDMINIFRTSYPLGYIFAAIASAIVLLVFPLKAIFILTAGVVLSALYPACRLEDNQAEVKI